MIYNHTPLDVVFNKNSDNFFVEEIPLYPFAHTGEWLMLKIRKKNITTPEMIKRIAEYLNVSKNLIGYAGLKDKDALTIQWISVPRIYRDEINKFQDREIKILEQDLHRNKLKIGHLKGNKFFVRFKKVTPTTAKILFSLVKDVKQYGIPNFFGEQRFGKYGNNFEEGKKIIDGEKFVKNKRLNKLLINAYQSKLFNDWLKERIKISSLFELSEKELLHLGYDKELINFIKNQKHPFKLLIGDIMTHYPFGRLFYLEANESERFLNKEIVPTGLLPGKKVMRAKGFAAEIERKFDDLIPVGGDRRMAWIFPEILEKNYNKDKAWFEMSFILPKGSYATVLVEILQNGIKGF